MDVSQTHTINVKNATYIPIRSPRASLSSLLGWGFDRYNFRSSSVCSVEGRFRMRILRGIVSASAKKCLCSALPA